MRKRAGFTLIELLVVIAIIGILAAMLFPVFARARESARKTQCLANVKNIAIAIAMYTGDWEAFPPANANQGDAAWVAGLTLTDEDEPRCFNQGGEVQWAWRADPYLRWPILLDDYVKNRDVWRCPSAKLQTGAAFIVPMGPNGNWRQGLQISADAGLWGEANMGYGFGICATSYPTGWGGEITDSAVQGALAGANILSYGGDTIALRSFVQTVAYNGGLVGTKMSTLDDTARAVVCADGGGLADAGSPTTIAYPDICCAECSGVAYFAWGGWPDPNGCPDGTYCPDCPPIHAMLDFAQSPTVRKGFSRHLGGSNIGFADGHAKWYSSEAVLASYGEGGLENIYGFCTGGTKKGYEAACGAPPAGMIFLYQEPE